MFSAPNARLAPTLAGAFHDLARFVSETRTGLAAFLLLLPITALIYAIELSGSHFVPVFWYLYLPIIGLATYRRGLAPGVVIAGACCAIVAPIVMAELTTAGLTVNAIAQLSAVSLFVFASFMTSYLVSLQKDLELKVELVSSEQAKTQRVLEAITDVVCTTDTICRVNSVNGGMLDGRPVDPILVSGRSLCDLFAPVDDNGESLCPDRCPVRASASTQAVFTASASFTPPDGRNAQLPVMWTAAPLPPDPDSPSGVVSVLRDMSRDEELGRLKRDFVSMVSHELRSPLTNMSAAIEILQVHPPTREKREELFSTVQSEVIRLSRFVEEILDAEKIERGEMPLNMEPVSLPPIVSRVVRQFERRSIHRRFDFSWQPDLPFVSADAEKVERVLHNLVANAVNYSAEGSKITLRLKTDGEDVLISVSDHGVGIPPNRIRSVFDRFYRAHIEDSQTVYGYGLGLYICKQLTEAQGGEITVESKEGLGSTFTVRLPALRTET